MQLLEYTHNYWLVFASLLVAVMAGMVGLSFTQYMSTQSDAQKKVRVALAAVTLGSGIWAMHFVAMLSLQLPIQFYYDAAITLASALVAILIVGLALLILHFTDRTRTNLTISGVIIGLGILAMHYMSMEGLEPCMASYTPLGIGMAVICSCLLNIAAVSIAYGKRKRRNIVFGAMFFGSSVFSVHFIAIWGTSFVAADTIEEVGPLIGNEAIAMSIVVMSFVLCGAFLMTGVTLLKPLPAASEPLPSTEAPKEQARPQQPRTSMQVPYEQEKRTQFMSIGKIAAIQAEGHYTHIYTATDKLFCVWSITEAEKRLKSTSFIKTHRSYLINPAFVSGFERNKDNGVCRLDVAKLERVPVSRSHLHKVRAALGL